MKIWLVSNLFAPDVHGGAALYADMAEWFNARGHDIRVTTTFSYYPAWKLRTEDEKLILRDEVWRNIPVRRVKMHVPLKPSGAQRLLSDASFLWAILRYGKFRDWEPDAIITAEPMLSQCVALRFLYPSKRIPRLIIVQDFVADAAIELGLLKSAPLIRAARWLERWSLSSATAITTISPPMLAKLEQIGPRATPKHYVPNWIHGSLAEAAIRKLAKPAKRARFTLAYSGNLGVKQGLPDFVRLFTSFAHDWTLRIHGDGATAVELRNLLATLNDSRVVLGPVLDDESYLELLLGVAASVVTQKPGVGANFLPSKVLPCLATGTPVLAICPSDSPLGHEIQQSGCGVVVSDQTPKSLALSLAALAADQPQHQKFSEAALARSSQYTRDQSLNRFAALIGITNG